MRRRSTRPRRGGQHYRTIFLKALRKEVFLGAEVHNQMMIEMIKGLKGPTAPTQAALMVTIEYLNHMDDMVKVLSCYQDCGSAFPIRRKELHGVLKKWNNHMSLPIILFIADERKKELAGTATFRSLIASLQVFLTTEIHERMAAPTAVPGKTVSALATTTGCKFHGASAKQGYPQEAQARGREQRQEAHERAPRIAVEVAQGWIQRPHSHDQPRQEVWLPVGLPAGEIELQGILLQTSGETNIQQRAPRQQLRPAEAPRRVPGGTHDAQHEGRLQGQQFRPHQIRQMPSSHRFTPHTRQCLPLQAKVACLPSTYTATSVGST
jgi:hypothetical protein